VTATDRTGLENDSVPRILIADPLAQAGLDVLREVGALDEATGCDPAELRSRIRDCQGLVVRSETRVDRELLHSAPSLRIIGRAGVGVDTIDVEEASRRGILVINAPAGNTIAAAEHAIALMLSLMRNIPPADRMLHEGGWERKAFMGEEVRQKTLGVFGLGRIGFEVARIASAGLKMHVLAYDPVVTVDRAQTAGAELVTLEELLGRADILTLHTPLTESTRKVIDRRRLAQMKRGVRIVNAARGGLIDEEALVDAIESGHVGGAALDVYEVEPLPQDHPLRASDRVILTPHLGASTREAQVNVAVEVAAQFKEFFQGTMPRYAVNAPVASAEDLERLRPFMLLSRKMGSLASQLSSAPTERVTCTYLGALAQLEPAFLTAEILGGFFAHFSDAQLNAVNARLFASDHGIVVEEARSNREVEEEDSIELSVKGSPVLGIRGALVDGAPRITRIDDYRVNMFPDGTHLFVEHADRPGVIARISTLLAENDVNIARIDLGRDRPRGHAVMFMQVDDPVPPPLQDRLRDEAGLESLRVVTLS